MKKNLLLLLSFMLTFMASAQENIFYENFGTSGYFRGPANSYTGFSSDASQFSSDSIGIHNWDPRSDYPGASGEGFALCGYNGGNVLDLMVISGINTNGYSNIHLSFGAATWYGLASSFIDITYSTDGTNWTPIDDQDVISGHYGDASWGFVTLGASLPSVPDLRLKFHNTDKTQAVRFDDITVSGVGVDNTPPSSPSGLRVTYKTFNAVGLAWDASVDDVGLARYDIYQDGILVKTVDGNSAELKYLSPGTTTEFTVVAVDLVDNASPASSPLPVTLDPLPADFRYDWQKQQATVLPDGDLEWTPHPFVYEAGNDVRYIDFENGDDTSDGLSAGTPWKHHPWDPQATANAAGASGIRTYVFKRGVIYRGSLNAKESGEPGNPVRLTSDPSWGSGEACIYGSVPFTSGWIQADAIHGPQHSRSGEGLVPRCQSPRHKRHSRNGRGSDNTHPDRTHTQFPGYTR